MPIFWWKTQEVIAYSCAENQANKFIGFRLSLLHCKCLFWFFKYRCGENASKNK